ncbi:MAG TPA: hypothetical protein VFX92_04275 [Candidatus Krumholzibacteria bacterium]|nr:hypothetical protein [Candidatus Krumholzibacteria bacterium]
MLARIAITTCAFAIAVVPGPSARAATAPPDTTMTLPGGSDGKNLDSITVEGEDRVRVRFERPALELTVDPSTAPGLDWQSLWTVLAPEAFDFTAPLYARSAFDRAWYAPEPWFDAFRDGPVARFRPNVSNVEAWSLEVADSRGNRVASFDGKGSPPKEIAWDGATTQGGAARADLTYSYVLNAMDQAGNKRSFVGDSFEIPPYLHQDASALSMSFAIGADSGEIPVGYIEEAASRINEFGSASRPVKIEVTAPTYAIAHAIADDVANALRPRLRGDATRVLTTTNVDAGGGERAAVVIQTGGNAVPAQKQQP